MPMRSRLFVVMAVMGSSLLFGGWLLGRGLGGPATGPVNGERLFDQVVTHVRRYYVDSVSTPELFDKALTGMMEELGDPLGAEFRKVYGDLSRPGPLRAALTARNDSLLAHGIQPIPQQKAEQLYEHVLALARQTDPAILDEWLPKATPVRFHPF